MFALYFYIYRNSLQIHLHSISIMRCWMGRLHSYLFWFYFYISLAIFYPHYILCIHIPSIDIVCDLERVERCHLESPVQMPKHFTCDEVRDFSQNIPPFRWFEATLYALWLASDNCDFCINTFSAFSESSGCGNPRSFVWHTINAFRFPFAKCDTVVWALCLTACCYVSLPNKHFMSRASWSHRETGGPNW